MQLRSQCDIFCKVQQQTYYQPNLQNNAMNNKTNQSRKPHFQNSWSITYRKPNYDALGDPHASYYFYNSSMRKHLNSLKKTIEREGSFVEKKKIKKMIKQRIQQFDSTSKEKAEAYLFAVKSSSSLASIRSKNSLLEHEKQLISESKRYSRNPLISQKGHTIDVASRRYAKKSAKGEFFLPKLSANNEEEKADVSKTADKELLLQKINKTQHSKFMKFILEKKRMIEGVKIQADPSSVKNQ